MKGIVADINFQGHLARLMYILRSPDWLQAWDDLQLAIHTFRSLGLDQSTPDRIVFEHCQSLGLCLLTGNRNHDGPNSLEAVIRQANPDALPVFTLGNAQRVLEDPAFAETVALHLLEYLIDMKKDPAAYRGTRRQYLPKSAL